MSVFAYSCSLPAIAIGSVPGRGGYTTLGLRRVPSCRGARQDGRQKMARFGRHISDRKKLVAGSLINMVHSPVFGDEARGGKSTELPSVRRRRAEWYQYRRSASS